MRQIRHAVPRPACYSRLQQGYAMVAQSSPRVVRAALDLMKADPVRAWTVDEIALACGVGPRTLQRQLQRFVGRVPMAFLRDLRLDRARQELLRAAGSVSVTDIGGHSGFSHM